MDAGSIGLKILEMLSPLLLGAMAWASVKLAGYIRAKTKNEYLANVLLRLEDAVFTAVKEMQQTVVDQIKTANADGVITDEEKKAVKDKAVASVKAYVGTKGLLQAAKVLGLDGSALEGFLSSKVEAAVHDLKHATPAPNMWPASPLAPPPSA